MSGYYNRNGMFYCAVGTKSLYIIQVNLGLLIINFTGIIVFKCSNNMLQLYISLFMTYSPTKKKDYRVVGVYRGEYHRDCFSRNFVLPILTKTCQQILIFLTTGQISLTLKCNIYIYIYIYIYILKWMTTP